MRVIRCILLCLPLFLGACSSDESGIPNKDGKGTVTFSFKVESGIHTRTVLNGSESLQHVSAVYLYVFGGTTDDARYVMTKQIPWPAASDADVNYRTATRTDTLALPEGEYTFLAVGLDDQSGATYDLPGRIGSGTTLANATAVLAVGKTKENMAASELFAGSATASVIQNGNAAVPIDLLRRVAGVMGWFTNIPSGTTEIQIALYTQQNKSAYLKAQAPGNSVPPGISNPVNFKDYITSPVSNLDAGKVLVSVNVPAGTGPATILSGGSYVLPAAAPAVGDGSEYSIRINLVSGGTVSKSLRTMLSPGDTFYIPPTGTDTGAPFRFPVVANHFYGIGSPDLPVDLGGDDEAIYIEINPNWSRLVDVPFE